MDKLEVLVVEDEERIRQGVCDVLAFNGYEPTGVESGEEGLELGSSGRFALVLLDVMLPEMNGFEVCEALRARRPHQAIIMLTAKGAEADVLDGFKCGADDYVPKPFSVRELLARIEALLRRAGKLGAEQSAPFAFGDWEIQPEQRQAMRDDEAVELTKRELELLALFVREPGRIVSRRRLLQEVWGHGNVEGLNTRTVDVHIAKLRKKIDAAEVIETVRGEGYRYSA